MQESKKESQELMNNDSGNWYGPFYFNRNDSRIMVPKINPALGGTFNLASPYAIVIIFAIIASIVLTSLYSI
jgi:uncharacterized membrane protein